MTGVLRPVGNPVSPKSIKLVDSLFFPYYSVLYGSGTEALCAAIQAAVAARPDITKPEVILPAYGCPDLVSAVLHADAHPCLVDLDEDTPYLSLQGINAACNEHTVAIIGVRFFGIAERNMQLMQLCHSSNITFIEDSAQGYPNTDSNLYWSGDYIVLSFGRGKPVNLLGGGAVLTADKARFDRLPCGEKQPSSLLARWKYQLKIAIYNQTIQPFIYGLISRLPGLNIGQTRFKPLHTVRAMAEESSARLTANLQAYKQRNSLLATYSDILKDLPQNTLITDLPVKLKHNMLDPLLRYPLLIHDKDIRDSLIEKLKSCGVSDMYKIPLFKIDGARDFIVNKSDSFKQAQNLADHLLTLPLHEDVDTKVLEKIKFELAECLKREK